MTDLNELQIKLDKASEYVQNSQFDEAINELKKGMKESDCSVCQLEIGIIVADINYNKEICILDNELCTSEKEILIEKIKILNKDFELAKEY